VPISGKPEIGALACPGHENCVLGIKTPAPRYRRAGVCIQSIGEGGS
jgi:hypothetical protein